MSGEVLAGLTDAEIMFDAIPTAAEQELVVELGLIGRDVLAVQRRLVPVRTGELSGALALAVQVEQLRVRIGLINPKLAPFYGRIVEFGRKAHTVLVQRRRRVEGRLRSMRGRKRSEDIVTSYPLHVAARAPHPYINPDQPNLETLADARVSAFWSEVMNRSGAAA